MTEITQADIDAAKLYLQGTGPWKIDEIGIQEDDYLVQAFAHHRLEERAKIVAWLRELAEEQGFLSVEDIEKAMNNKWTGDGLAENERIEALQADKAKLREEIDRLGEALVAEREENLWSAYNTGDVRGDEWTHLYMSDGEWLVRQCGLDPKQIYYKAEQIRNAIPIAARAALQETGQ